MTNICFRKQSKKQILLKQWMNKNNAQFDLSINTIINTNILLKKKRKEKVGKNYNNW